MDLRSEEEVEKALKKNKDYIGEVNVIRCRLLHCEYFIT